MNNNSKRVLAAFAVAVAVLLSLFLLTDKSPLAIAAFIFSLAAPAMFFGMMFMTAAGSMDKYPINASFIIQARSYAIWNLLVCGIAVLADQLNLWHMPVAVFCVIQIILLAFFIWRYLSMDAGKEEINRVEKEVKIKVTNWKMIEADLRSIGDAADQKYRKQITDAADAVRYADPMSCDELTAIDDSIKDTVLALELAAQKNDDDAVAVASMKILRLVKERNTKAKILK